MNIYDDVNTSPEIRMHFCSIAVSPIPLHIKFPRFYYEFFNCMLLNMAMIIVIILIDSKNL